MIQYIINYYIIFLFTDNIHRDIKTMKHGFRCALRMNNNIAFVEQEKKGENAYKIFRFKKLPGKLLHYFYVLLLKPQ